MLTGSFIRDVIGLLNDSLSGRGVMSSNDRAACGVVCIISNFVWCVSCVPIPRNVETFFFSSTSVQK
jgi:hypothetical protein